MISDAAQNSRFEREEANQRELLGKLEGLEAADVYLQVCVGTIEEEEKWEKLGNNWIEWGKIWKI